MPVGLYVLATPLGNLGDLSPRAADVLAAASVIAAEDTRRTGTLVRHLGLTASLLSYHAHSPPGREEEILGHLRAGRSVALVSDAGTPTVSDPGAGLVAAVRKAGFAVIAVPGPSAVAAALSVSGLPADRYTFEGFPPRKGRDRTELLGRVAASPWTVVLFEAPPRLVRLLDDLAHHCGADRRAVVVRELTKLHEETRAGTLGELAGYYRDTAPRGEITVVISGTGRTRPPRPAVEPAALEDRAAALLAEGLSRRDTATRLAAEFHVPRKEAYRVVTAL